MTTKNKRIVYVALALFTFASCTATIFFSFYFSDALQRMVNSVLKLEIYPPLIGGPVARTVYDPMKDDTGYGELAYPANRQFAEGNLDLVSYTVREPVFHAPWQDVPEFWQLELEFRTGFGEQSGAARNRTIYIYLNVPGFAGGSRETLRERSELVAFSPEYPWHYALAVTGDSGTIHGQNGDTVAMLDVLYSNSGKKVFIKVPLVKKELQRLYTIDSIRHYVLVAAHSPLDIGGVLPVSRRKTRTAGGGATSPLTPRIYDILSETGQGDMLSSWNDATFELARVEPVEIPMRRRTDGTRAIDQERIVNLESERKAIGDKLHAQKLGRLGELRQSGSETVREREELAILSFDVGETEIAERLFDELLREDSGNPRWLAYKGSLESMKGDGAPVVAAVKAVETGYRYLDEAIARSDGTLEKARNATADRYAVESRVDALLNRGGTSKAVPNEVFLKALQGARDFLEASELFLLSDNELSYANCCLSAAECFALDGKHGEAAIWKREAARIVRERVTSDGKPLSEPDRMLLLDLEIALLKEGLL